MDKEIQEMFEKVKWLHRLRELSVITEEERTVAVLRVRRGESPFHDKSK